MENIAGFNWNKNWSGNWTLLECFYYGKYYTTSLQKYHAVGVQHAAFISKNGLTANYLVKTELEHFGKALADRIVADPAVASHWGEQAKIQGDRALELMEKIEGREITKADYDTLWDILEQYLVVSFPIKRVGDYLPAEILNNLLPMFEKVRVYGEPVYAQSALFIKKFAAQIASQTGLSAGLVLVMTDDEFSDFLVQHRIPDVAVLEARFKASYLLVSGKMKDLVSGERVDAFENIMVGAGQTKDEIRGMSAYKGKVTGQVRVVFDPSKIQIFEPNTILVTGMTRPEYLHLFEQAVAVVTDAGGVLSHAAITARELKKPTVVGTEKATKFFKDGDMVVVDADRGVVKKIL